MLCYTLRARVISLFIGFWLIDIISLVLASFSCFSPFPFAPGKKHMFTNKETKKLRKNRGPHRVNYLPSLILQLCILVNCV
jgi:hypothetical protein